MHSLRGGIVVIATDLDGAITVVDRHVYAAKRSIRQ
jgi:hypothetical protein